MGESLRYDLINPGGSQTVVLLHSLALDGTIWSDFASRLGPESRVLTPDLPGHGARPHGDPDSVETMADAVAELLTELGMAEVTLIGMSLGGSVAQALTIRHPERIAKLGLIDTTAWYGEDAPTAWASRAQQARERGLSSLAGFQLERWFTEAFTKDSPELGAELLEIFQRNDIENYVKSCTALGAMDLRSQLAGIDVPTAVVVGALDQATPPKHAELLAASIRNSALTVLPDCKHLSALEQPDAVIHALGAILGESAQVA
ncbi:alpha/beta fold hydrolase [Jatrophihabitans sp. DSM 45814]